MITREKIEVCAQDELLSITPMQVADIQKRWTICEEVKKYTASIPVQEMELALGKPASHSVVQASVKGKQRMLLEYPSTQERPQTSSVDSIVHAPKVKSSGQTPSEVYSQKGMDVETAFEKTKSVFEHTLSIQGDISLAQASWKLGARATALKVQSGQWDPKELWTSYAAKSSMDHASLQAYEYLYEWKPSAGPLQGIPVAVKSLFWVDQQPCTASSKALCRWMAPTDADVVAGLRQSGVSFLGAVRMDEFAMGGSGQRSAFGPSHHPFLPGFTPGGSSSGSAAAVAAGDALIALGSDTGGSVRQPASYCGLWGLKTTWGGLSRFGMVPYSFSFDTPGVITTRCDDLVMAYEGMSLVTSGDATCVQASRKGLMKKIESGTFKWLPADMVLGTVLELEDFLSAMSPSARGAYETWKEKARRLGFQWKSVSIPSLTAALASYYTLVSVEAQSSLARYDPLRFGFEQEALDTGLSYEMVSTMWRTEAIGQEARQRALFGALLLSDEQSPSLYAQVVALRKEITKGFAQAFEQVDFLVTPTTIGLPPSMTKQISVQEEWSQDMLSVGASLAGICAVSAPWSSFEKDGLWVPQGIQFMASWHAEDALLGALWQWEAHGLFEDHSVLSRP